MNLEEKEEKVALGHIKPLPGLEIRVWKGVLQHSVYAYERAKSGTEEFVERVQESSQKVMIVKWACLLNRGFQSFSLCWCFS